MLYGIPLALFTQDMNLEKLTSDCILQSPVEVVINGKKQVVAKPTLGTLIEASSLIGEIPELGEIDLDKASSEKILAYCLHNAQYCSKIALILATLILGRKGKRKAYRREKKPFLWLFSRNVIVEFDQYEELAEKILDTMSCEEIVETFSALLGMQNLGFFLQLTTSLRELNLLKRSKED